MAGDDLTLRVVYVEGDPGYPTQHQGPPAPHPTNPSIVRYPDGSIGSPPPASIPSGPFNLGPQGVAGYMNPEDLPRSQGREPATTPGPAEALQSIPSWMIPSSIRDQMKASVAPASPGPSQPIEAPSKVQIPGVPSWMIPSVIQGRIDEEAALAEGPGTPRMYKRYPWKDPNFVPEPPPVWVPPVPPPLAPVSLVPLPQAGGAGGAPPSQPPPPVTGPPPGEGDPNAWTGIPSFKTGQDALNFFQQYGRWPAPGDAPGTPMPGTPSGAGKFFNPDRLSEFWKRLKEEAGEPISRYGISSAAYAVGGAVGRLTGSPSAGIIAGASTRGGLSMAAGAGVITAGAVAIGTGIILAITGVIESFSTLTRTANELSEDFSKVSGPFAAVIAMNQAQRTLQDIQLAQRSAPQLTSFLDQQNELFMAWRELKTTITKDFIGIVTEFMDGMTGILNFFNWMNKEAEEVQKKSHLGRAYEDARLGPKPPDKNDWNEMIDRFLDPSRPPDYSRGPAMPAFPRPPRRRAGVF